MKDMRNTSVLDPPIPEARIERQWENISARLERGARWSLRNVSLAAGVLAVVATGIVVGVRRAPSSAQAFFVESVADGDSNLVFGDGSRVTVTKGGRLHVEHATQADVAMSLESGKARFDVKHDGARRFAVRIGEIEVVDRGTRFEIARAEGERPGVDVRVEEGEIDLRDPLHPEARRLTAGESWSNRPPEADIKGASVVTAPSFGITPSANLAASPGVSLVNGQAVPSSDPALDGRPKATLAPRAAESARTSEGARNAAMRTARELFEVGNAAKMSGQLQEAAEAFDTLRLRHRADAHAALAALELGRLRLNHLGDPAGALVALQDAVRLGPKAPFREEAEAKVVDALAALGRTAECQRGRDQFLARYPRSVHAASVADKCGGR